MLIIRNMYISRVVIKNFRTFTDFDININQNLQVIAWANNSWKSNFLRALNLFFNWFTDNNINFSRKNDVSFIKSSFVQWSTNSPVYICVEMTLESWEISKITGLNTYCFKKWKIYLRKKFTDNEEIITVSNDGIKFDNKDIVEGRTHPINTFLRRVKFIYLPTQSEVSDLINELVWEEILPTMTDSYGNTWLSKKIKDLKRKMDKIDEIIKEIFDEKNALITSQFQKTLSDFPEIEAWIPIENYKLEIELNEDESITDILSKRIELVVKDASHNSLSSKWSGIQKLVLITLLQYFTKDIEAKARYTNPFLIWAIDEPESFMQPKLQKKIREIFLDVSKTNQVIVSTHSPKLIDINNISDTILFYLTSDKKKIARKMWKIFFVKETKYLLHTDDWFINTLKEHFWIETNDWWLILDKNILFEWNDDEVYFHSTYKAIIWKWLEVWSLICKWASNFPSFLELLNDHISKKKLLSKSIICLLDNDQAWRDAIKNISSKKIVSTKKTISMYMDESDFENINYPQMIEDMVIPEVFFESIIKFLSEKDSSIDLSVYNFKDFFIDRKKCLRTPIMEFADNFFDITLQYLWISLKSLDIKYWISLKYYEIICNKTLVDIDDYRTKYPSLIKFLNSFTK